MAKKRILLVDDEAIVTRTLKLYLDGTGQYEVKTVNQGSKAVRVAKGFRPNLILLDVIMPDMDGGAVAAAVEADEDLKGTPIVFLTALVTEKEVGPSGRDIGGYPFIAKPLDPDKVVECIEAHASED